MKNSEVNWTEKQKETIENRNNNILVSAAAGSGKTAVLIERIKQLIIVDEISIDRILVVTFTKAAASEMKEKLLAALNKACLSYPEKVGLLRTQLDRIGEANISTFHSFALDVIRKYFHVIQLDPGFKVCDEAESRIMKSEGMDYVFDKLFEEGDTGFLQYVDSYAGSKNETQLKANIIGLYEKLRSIPESLHWLKDAVEQTNLPPDAFLKSPAIGHLMGHLIDKTKESRELFNEARSKLEEYGLERQAEKCSLEIKSVDEIIESLKRGDLDGCGRLICQFKGETIRGSKGQEEEYGEIKDIVKGYRDRAKGILKELKEKFFSIPWMTCLEDVGRTYESGTALYHILLEFDGVYSQIKRDKGLLDFGDIEHFAIEILDDPLVSREYQNKFQYIFIDEYQDSNILQERIIESIKRANNVFMVGDIKQSIYKFRLAEPEIFHEKYRSYKLDQTSDSITIDLNRNFRSKPPVIEAVNGIFSQLMEYNEEAALKGETPPSTVAAGPVELVVVDGSVGGGCQADIEDGLEELKLVELEALAAADVIREHLNKPIFDSKRGDFRPLRKKDIVILMHGVKGKASTFYKILVDAGIDCYVDDHAGYFDTIEITQFLDLLKVVDNFNRDVPLIGVLHSPFFNFTVDDFVEIRNQCPGRSFHEAMISYKAVGKIPQLVEKVKDAIDKITGWKRASKYLPIHEFVWTLMVESGFYTYMGGFPGGDLRQANLRIFVDRARKFRDTGDGSIYSFIRYINTLAEKDIETEQAKVVGENDDVVRVMTIHKSKGLEFPMVIVASLGNKLIFDKIERSGVMHKEIGIGLTRMDADGRWYRNTLIQHVIAAKKKREELEEAVRVLYVAFTRAMDHLILLGTVKNWEKEKIKFEAGLKAESNYLGMIFPHLAKGCVNLTIKSRSDLSTSTKEKSNRIEILNTRLKNPCGAMVKTDGDDGLESVIGQRLSYFYPHTSDLMIKSKYSVSEIVAPKGEVDAIRKPAFLSGEHTLSSTEFGDAIHIVMEHIDTTRYHVKEYLSNYLDSLVNRELLTSTERLAVNSGAVSEFAQCQLGRRLGNAKNIHREEPFNFMYDFNGKQVMIQGIVDCWFEEAGKIILIDYKTGAGKTTMIGMYEEQLKLYRIGLEAILNQPVTEAYLYFFGDGLCHPVL